MSSTATTRTSSRNSRHKSRPQQFTPVAALDLAAERDKLASQLAGVRQELARERAASAALRRIAAELAIELDQARSEIAASGKVIPLPSGPGHKSE